MLGLSNTESCCRWCWSKLSLEIDVPKESTLADRYISFDEALEETREVNRHLLLGNGFSIGCFPDIFTYASLLDQADFSSNPRLRQLFVSLDVIDFEQVIRVVQGASRVLPCYISNYVSFVQEMKKDADMLKEVLIQTLIRKHPNYPADVSDVQFWFCRKFLSNFVEQDNSNGKIYTLNYDLLLYWALMHTDSEEFPKFNLANNDGFGRDEYTEPEYVNWMGETASRGQRIHYLHGALHLFDADGEVSKYTWVNTGISLVDQARDAINNNKFPLFVAEGESKKKLTRIKHSAYLYHSYKSFAEKTRSPNDVLFIYGHSLDDNDSHIFNKIVKGRNPKLYVSLYGDLDSEANRGIRARANSFANSRDSKSSMEVIFYDAESAKVWG